MRKVFISVALIILSLSLRAQYAGYNLTADPAKFTDVFSTTAKNTVSIKSDFVQEKNLSMLSEKIVSKGKFWFRKDNLVRMEYVTPFTYLMIINKDKVYIKDGQKQSTISIKSNKLFQQINKITVDCIQGNILNNPDFKIRIFENKAGYLVELVPVDKSLKDFFQTITVSVDKGNYVVDAIQMNEVSGDNTIIHFTNKEANTNIPDALFVIK